MLQRLGRKVEPRGENVVEGVDLADADVANADVALAEQGERRDADHAAGDPEVLVVGERKGDEEKGGEERELLGAAAHVGAGADKGGKDAVHGLERNAADPTGLRRQTNKRKSRNATLPKKNESF